MSSTASQQSRLKVLIARGREQGYLTYAEVNDHLPENISDPDQVEDIIQMINDLGIKVSEAAPHRPLSISEFAWQADGCFGLRDVLTVALQLCYWS